jgi:hypothetical protein
LSRSSSTIRSAVFFPMPGTRVSFCTSAERITCTRSPAAMPLNTVRASFGPTPLTVISFSNSDFSSAERKPNSWIASSRTTVWIRSRTSSPGAGSAVKVEIGMATS